jgi:tetratricopeptide (TPR) repeat protein
LKRIGGAEVLAERREEPAAWWWHIDDLVQEQRQERGRRVLFWILGIAIGVALLVLGYRQFLAPDPETVKVVGHEMDAETLVIREGDLTAALEEINAGLSYAADNPQLLIFKGVLEESLGNEEAAADVYAEAQQLMEDEEDFLVNRAERYLMVGNAEGVLTDAQRLLEINPDSARAYYFRGAVAEQREEWSTAYTNYKTASELAMESGEPDFYVFVRTRMADVMNRIETPAVETPPGEE